MSDLCKCGHTKKRHRVRWSDCRDCGCDEFTQVPVDRDDLAAILAKHRLLNQFQRTGLSVVVNHACSCDDWTHPAGGDWAEAHRAHVAQMVLESDWLRGIKTQAIDELKTFLPEWNYPSYVVAAISLELRERLGIPHRADNTTDRT